MSGLTCYARKRLSGSIHVDFVGLFQTRPFFPFFLLLQQPGENNRSSRATDSLSIREDNKLFATPKQLAHCTNAHTYISTHIYARGYYFVQSIRCRRSLEKRSGSFYCFARLESRRTIVPRERERWTRAINSHRNARDSKIDIESSSAIGFTYTRFAHHRGKTYTFSILVCLKQAKGRNFVYVALGTFQQFWLLKATASCEMYSRELRYVQTLCNNTRRTRNSQTLQSRELVTLSRVVNSCTHFLIVTINAAARALCADKTKAITCRNKLPRK